MKGWRASDRSAGFVLVNALVIVAAMAAAATLLLTRAEGGRVRLAALQEAEALGHALDAFESLSRAVLDRDLSNGPIDTTRDIWAEPINDVPLELGRVSGRIEDQQAMFNLNWLANTSDTRALDGFAVLLQRIGFSAVKGDLIVAYLSPEGPNNKEAFSRMNPPIAPLGGSILLFEQLGSVPGLTAEDLDLLRGHVTALPSSSRININTASVHVLTAMLPELPPGQADTVLQRRLKEPYATVSDLFEELTISDDPEDPDAVDPSRFSVGSNWFEAQILATLGPRTARRRVLLRRENPQAGTQIEWRVSRFN